MKEGRNEYCMGCTVFQKRFKSKHSRLIHRSRSVICLNQEKQVLCLIISDDIRQGIMFEWEEMKRPQSFIFTDKVFVGRVSDIKHLGSHAKLRQEFFYDFLLKQIVLARR